MRGREPERRTRILLHGREAGLHSTTPTYTAGKDSPAREPSWSAFWLQKPSILCVCVREEDAGGEKGGRAFYYIYIYSFDSKLEGVPP